MCSRYSVLTKKEIIEVREILRKISLRVVGDDFLEYEGAAGEIRPTDSAPVIVARGNGVAVERQKFGFRRAQPPGVIINARSDTLEEKPVFSRLLKSGRCVVPAAEFFEWKDNGKSGKVKHYARGRGGNILFFAGLCQSAEKERDFVIITKDSTGEMAKIHNRVPVILRAEQIWPWLSGKIGPKDLLTMDFDLTVRPCDENEAIQVSLFDM
ncbi:MAG: SOS response-associated peptidase [Defluviitaleaceae bacterium]|nr:SOS response-associated peptidase [Defluviitaleaceae bacterium]